jgi:hypothetical protein
MLHVQHTSVSKQEQKTCQDKKYIKQFVTRIVSNFDSNYERVFIESTYMNKSRTTRLPTLTSRLHINSLALTVLIANNPNKLLGIRIP